MRTMIILLIIRKKAVVFFMTKLIILLIHCAPLFKKCFFALNLPSQGEFSKIQEVHSAVTIDVAKDAWAGQKPGVGNQHNIAPADKAVAIKVTVDSRQGSAVSIHEHQYQVRHCKVDCHRNPVHHC